MKKLERIFLYSVLAILVFCVFLVDNNAESQAVIQEEIRARRIVIVNDAGQEVVNLGTYEGNGTISIFNKAGTLVVDMLVLEGGGGIATANKTGTLIAMMGASVGDIGSGVISIANKYGNVIASMEDQEDCGKMIINNKDGNGIASMMAAKDGSGVIGVCNKYSNPVVLMAVRAGDNGGIMVFNKDGKTSGRLP
jgi:hypothetical protein